MTYRNKYKNYRAKKAHANRFKNESKRRSYLDRLFVRIFLSSLCLLAMVASNSFFKYDIREKLNQHLNFASITNYLFGSFIPNFDFDETVSSMTIYDNIEYIDGKNHIKNESQNAVLLYAGGTVVKISKNNNLYSVTVKGFDEYLYVYSNLEGIDCMLYEYIGAEGILGQAFQNQFTIEVVKDNLCYSLYEIHTAT